jgi:uncharacterized membrane protein (UPF0127 family)
LGEERSWSVRVERTQQVLATRAAMARTAVERMRGLLGRRRLEEGEGLIFPSCRAIHTCGMRFAIDAVFTNGDGKVVAIMPWLRPWRVSRIVWRSQAVIELPAGTAKQAQLVVGDRVLLYPPKGSKCA